MGADSPQARSRSPSAVCNCPVNTIVTICVPLLHPVVGSAIDSAESAIDNGDHMQSLDIHNPGMPDLQFVLFVSALCTSNLRTINVPEPLRRTIFDRCWTLIKADPPP